MPSSSPKLTKNRHVLLHTYVVICISNKYTDPKLVGFGVRFYFYCLNAMRNDEPTTCALITTAAYFSIVLCYANYEKIFYFDIRVLSLDLRYGVGEAKWSTTVIDWIMVFQMMDIITYLYCMQTLKIFGKQTSETTHY